MSGKLEKLLEAEIATAKSLARTFDGLRRDVRLSARERAERWEAIIRRDAAHAVVVFEVRR